MPEEITKAVYEIPEKSRGLFVALLVLFTPIGLTHHRSNIQFVNEVILNQYLLVIYRFVVNKHRIKSRS